MIQTLSATRGGNLPARFYLGGGRVNRKTYDEVFSKGRLIETSTRSRTISSGDFFQLRTTTRHIVEV